MVVCEKVHVDHIHLRISVEPAVNRGFNDIMDIPNQIMSLNTLERIY